MYADRVEAAAKKSVKERLNGNFSGGSNRRRIITGKRQRQDDKWEHDLFEDNEEPRVLNDVRDLRLKLQRKSLLEKSVRDSISGVTDLREKLSGTMNPQPRNVYPPKPRSEAVRLVRKSVAAEAPEPTVKKSDALLENFLQSLGLEKYLISFQVEEIDMATLVHMTDDDLKALGIPMGPRKKILLELQSRR